MVYKKSPLSVTKPYNWYQGNSSGVGGRTVLPNVIPAFPVEFFPEVARSAIEEIAAETQAPISMVSSSIIAAMALAVQGQFRVRRREGLESPCSLAIVSICQSGERKTTVDKKVMRAFSEFQAERLPEFEKKYKDYRAERLIWGSKRRALVRQFERAVASNASLELLQAAISDHENSEPKPPRKVRLLYSDVTPAALLFGLHENTRSVALSEDEASRVLGGSISSDIGLIVKGWDGSDITVDRRKSESFLVKAPRISLNLMVQPKAFEQFMERKGDEARGVGLLARWLVCYPQSTQGNRFINDMRPKNDKQRIFAQRVKEILTAQLECGAMDSEAAEIVLTFSRDAECHWMTVANDVEHAIQPGGLFCQASDYASKVAENIARIAGVFHVFSGDPGTEISLETLRSAIMVAEWYAVEFVRLFAPADPLHQTVRDAIVLESWLLNLHATRKWDRVEKNFILKYGPNSLRNRDRLNWALDYLASAQQRVWIEVIGRRKQFVVLNLNYFGNLANGYGTFGFMPLEMSS